MGFWSTLGNIPGNVIDGAGKVINELVGTGSGPLASSHYTSPQNAAQSAAPSLGDVSQDRAALAKLAGQYDDLAAGRGPNLAAQQTAAGLAQQQAQTLGTVAQAGRGANPGVLAALAAQQQAQTGQATANAGAQLAGQQQIAAMGGVGQLYGANQGADLQAANLQQGNTQFNANQMNTFSLERNREIAEADAARKKVLQQLAAGGVSAASSLFGFATGA